MLTLHEYFLQLIALVLLALLLFTYAPRIATALSEKLAPATNAPVKMKVRL
jgi:hypothetical protein